MDSLLPILPEHVSQNAKNALTTIAVPQQPQTPLDELILPPIVVPKLHTTKSPPAIPYRTTSVEPRPSSFIATNYKTEPISLEIFNRAATDLNEKGIINIKKYKKFLQKPSH